MTETGDDDAPSGWEDDEVTTFQQALSSGAFFGDRFRVGSALGSGAMGRVVQAIDLQTNGEVALKILHPERAREPEAISRFEREAEILESIGHPGIVRIVAVGRAPGGTPWLAMELLRGETLKKKISRGPMAALEIIPLLNGICDPLAAAHIRGVVHRDLKPENILVVEGGQPPCKILDFGLSRFTASKTLTKAGTILGTPRYMPPEQIRTSVNADLRVDIFAVGVLLFEMLTGKSPYPAEDLGQLLGCVLEGRTIPLADLRPDLPAAVQQVITRAMARDPNARFQTAGAIAEAYANALGVSSGRSMLSGSPSVPPGPDGPAGEEGAEPLLDPFFVGGAPATSTRPSSTRPPALDSAVRPGELAGHPLLATMSPSVAAIAPDPTSGGASVAPMRELPRASWPGAGPPASFTRPRPSTPTPTPPSPAPARAATVAARARKRSPAMGCAIFVLALMLVTVVAAISAVALRALLHGRVHYPGIGGSP